MSINTTVAINTEGTNTSAINSQNDSGSQINLDSLDAASLADSALGLVSNVYDQHNFLISVLQDETKDDMSPEMLRTIQNSLEKFTVQAQLVGKAVSIAIKDIDTLVQLQ